MEVRAGNQQRTDVQTRRFGRVPFQAPVRLTRLSTGQELELHALNLSENGIFLETVIPFSEGELFRLSFPTAPSAFEQVAAARVVWRRPFGATRAPGHPPGVALSFVMMRPDDRQALATLVANGGIVPPRVRTTPSRAPVAARIVPTDAKHPDLPKMRFANTNGGATVEAMDIGPLGWLLVLALALAALASLLLGLQPV